MTVECTKCGYGVAEGASACPRCGTNTGPTIPSPPAQVIDYGRRAKPPEPTLAGEVAATNQRLRLADSVLSIIGWVYIVLGAGAFILAFVGAVAVYDQTGDRRTAALALAGSLFWAVGIVLAGILIRGVGAAFRMLGLIGLKSHG